MNHRFKTESARNRFLVPVVTLHAGFVARPARAANLTLQGLFTKGDDVQLFNVAVASNGSIDLRSSGYAGGTTATSAIVTRGGFDTVLTLFSASTSLRAATSSPSRNTRISLSATWQRALAKMSGPNFAADPGFASGGSCPGKMFRDISRTDRRCRDDNWTVSFNNVASVTPTAAVPEPFALLFTNIGLGIPLLMRVHRHHQQRTKLLVASAVGAIAASSQILAQTNPNFSKVNDILHGEDKIQLFSIRASRSQQTNSPPPAALESVDSPKPLQTFPAHMFNQSQAITMVLNR